MEDLKWRVWAKAVDIVDIVFWVISTPALIFIGVTKYNGDGSFFCVLTVMIVMQMCAAFTLLSATKLGNEMKKALNLARIWTIISTIFAVLSLIGSAIQLNLGGIIFWVLYRGVGFFVVIKFMTELKCGMPSFP